ncbi:hypothetical protein B0H13DRAFT_1909301 [Mycena leptocephala]|nr:hypothetical protein B0H13DRAFT_1909301 [Mycena leptocephala]
MGHSWAYNTLAVLDDELNFENSLSSPGQEIREHHRKIRRKYEQGDGHSIVLLLVHEGRGQRIRSPTSADPQTLSSRSLVLRYHEDVNLSADEFLNPAINLLLLSPSPPSLCDLQQIILNTHALSCLLKVGSLLFSSYQVEVSVDLNLQQHHIPGIGIPGKVLVAQITDELGSKPACSPLLSLVDWSGVPSDVQATSRSVVLHFADLRPVGTLAHLTGGTDDCSFGVRVTLEDQAAFWAFAYLLVKPLAHVTDIVADIRANGHLISQMFDYFKADNGSEYFEGTTRLDSRNLMIQTNQRVEAPPDYTESGAHRTRRRSNPIDLLVTNARGPTRSIVYAPDDVLSCGPSRRFVFMLLTTFCLADQVGALWFPASLVVPSLACRHLNILDPTAFLQQEERNGLNLTLKEGLTRCRPVSWPDLMLAGQLLVLLVGSEPPAGSNALYWENGETTDSEHSIRIDLLATNAGGPTRSKVYHGRLITFGLFPASLVDIFYYSGPKSIFSGEGRNDFNLKKGEKASMVIQGHSPWAQPLALRRSGNSTGSTRIIVCAPRDGHVDTFDLNYWKEAKEAVSIAAGTHGIPISNATNCVLVAVHNVFVSSITTNADHEPARRFLNRIFIFVALAFTNPQNADPEAEEDEMADAATYKKYREKQSVPHRIRQHLPDLNTPDGILDVLALRSYVVLFLALTSSAYPYLVKSRNDWHSHALQVKSDIWQEVHYAWTMALELDDYLLDDYKFEQVVPGTGPENFEEAADASPNTGRTYFAPEGKQPSRAMAVKLWRRFYQAVRPRRTHARHGRHDRRSKLQELALALCHIYAKAMCWVSMPAPPPSIHLQKIATSLATK